MESTNIDLTNNVLWSGIAVLVESMLVDSIFDVKRMESTNIYSINNALLSGVTVLVDYMLVNSIVNVESNKSPIVWPIHPILPNRSHKISNSLSFNQFCLWPNNKST